MDFYFHFWIWISCSFHFISFHIHFLCLLDIHFPFNFLIGFFSFGITGTYSIFSFEINYIGQFDNHIACLMILSLSVRGVVPGGAGCAMAHPDFGRSVNPISTRGTDYAHLITTGTPRFSDLQTALINPWIFSIQKFSFVSSPWKSDSNDRVISMGLNFYDYLPLHTTYFLQEILQNRVDYFEFGKY